MIFIQKISIVLDHKTKNSYRLFNICLSTNMITALVIPLSFILATLTTITMMGPAVYAYNNDYNNNKNIYKEYIVLFHINIIITKICFTF